MLVRKMIALLRGEPETDRLVLDCCGEIMRRDGSHLEAVHLTLGPAELATTRDEYFPDFPRDMAALYRQTCENRAQQSHELFEAWRQEAGIPLWSGESHPSTMTAQWREDLRSPDVAVSALGRFCDLIVAIRPNGRISAVSRLIIEGLLFTSGHPVLLVPPAAPVSILRSAIIAWNGSAEAVHAVCSAIPLLRAMSQVTIIQVLESGADRSEVQRLADFLQWHQITAETVTLPAGRDTGAMLLEASRKIGSGLLVMGAYTHSPTREQLLGGTTLHILQQADIPVLMAH